MIGHNKNNNNKNTKRIIKLTPDHPTLIMNQSNMGK